MSGARSGGSENDDFGHGLVVADIVRLFQTIDNLDTSSADSDLVIQNAADIVDLTARLVVIETLLSGMSVQTIDMCDGGTDKTMDIAGTTPV